MAVNPLLAGLLQNQRFGNPGFNPAAPDPRKALEKPAKPNVFDKADNFLSTPGGSFLVNLLSQSGFSTTPQSPFGAIGRAALATSQQGAQNTRSGLENELLRSRIGLANAQAEGGGNATAGNVQTTFKGANGNMHIVTRGGDVKDTNVAFNENIKFFTQPDDSVIGVDSSTGERIGTVVSPDEASRARDRKTRETDITKSAIELPQALAGLDQIITSIDSTIDTARGAFEQVTPGTAGLRGAITGGIAGTPAFDLRANIKTIQANLGFDQLQKMRNASKSGGALGQVSERELDLLISAVNSLDANQSETQLKENFERIFKHYDNYKREIEIMKVKLQERAGQPPTEKPLSEMSDAELQAIVDG